MAKHQKTSDKLTLLFPPCPKAPWMLAGQDHERQPIECACLEEDAQANAKKDFTVQGFRVHGGFLRGFIFHRA